MFSQRSKSKSSPLVTPVYALVFLCLAVSCGPSAEDRAAADLECQQLATARTGYDPANPAGDKRSVGKGAAVGAVGGAALGAITSSKSKNVVKGAAVGAAVGAGAGALKDKEDKARADQAASAYQAEYQHCMSGKGN